LRMMTTKIGKYVLKEVPTQVETYVGLEDDDSSLLDDRSVMVQVLNELLVCKVELQNLKELLIGKK